MSDQVPVHELVVLTLAESHDGELTALRLGGQFKVVHENQHNIVPEQGRHFQAEARQIPPGQLLPRLLRWQRCQQGCQVSTVEVQPSEPRTSESLPPVSALDRGCTCATSTDQLLE